MHSFSWHSGPNDAQHRHQPRCLGGLQEICPRFSHRIWKGCDYLLNSLISFIGILLTFVSAQLLNLPRYASHVVTRCTKVWNCILRVVLLIVTRLYLCVRQQTSCHAYVDLAHAFVTPNVDLNAVVLKYADVFQRVRSKFYPENIMKLEYYYLNIRFFKMVHAINVPFKGPKYGPCKAVCKSQLQKKHPMPH